MFCILGWWPISTNHEQITIRRELLQAGLRRAGPVEAEELKKRISICICFLHSGVLWCPLVSSGSLWGPSGVSWCNSVVPLGYLWCSSGVPLGYLWDPPWVLLGSFCCLLGSVCGPYVVLLWFFCCSSGVLLKSFLAKSLQSLIRINWYLVWLPMAS